VANLLNRVDNFLEAKPKTPAERKKSSPAPSPSTPGVCSPLSSSHLSSLLFYAPLSLSFIYSETPIELQLLSAQQGWSLLYAHLDQGRLSVDQPAHALLVHRKRKIATLVVRGTTTLNDVVTDLRAIPVPFPEESWGGFQNGRADTGCTSNDEEEIDWVKMGHDGNKGQALLGMAKVRVGENLALDNHLELTPSAPPPQSATYLFDENIGIIASLVSQGYVIRCTGHSLGGGVAALLGILIKRHFRGKGMEKDLEDLIRVYSFGTPSCVNEDLVREIGGNGEGGDSFITSVVLHDDIVPRITPTSVRRLMKHLLYVKETWVDKNFRDDVEAVADRVKNVWAPRWRNSFLVKEHGVNQQTDDDSGPTNNNGNGATTPPPPPYGQSLDQSLLDPSQFFDAKEELIDSDTDSDDADYVLEEAGGASSSLGNLDSVEEEKEGAGTSSPNSPASPVMLPEAPLPRMFIPGDIYHIYKHNGTYKACKVPRKFKELRRISLSPNMVSDHSCKSYYEALLEVRSVRGAKLPAPNWQPFHSASKCTACESEVRLTLRRMLPRVPWLRDI
jgi:hypothetical protein